MPTRAARDLIDALAKSKEPITVFALHDGDAAGSVIIQTLQDATIARGARQVKVLNLGIECWQDIAKTIEPEPIESDDDDRNRPVARYVIEKGQEDEVDYEAWYQTHRIELDKLTTEQLLNFIDTRISEECDANDIENTKVIPPDEVIAEEMNRVIREKVRQNITDKILREANLDGQVALEIERLQPTVDRKLSELDLSMWTIYDPTKSWREAVLDRANHIILITRGGASGST